MAILEPGPISGPPPAAQLDAAAAELRRRGELRLLIGMVERWSQVGIPSQRARLAQVEALLDLRMMDRAWTRLQALEDDDNLDRIKVTARMFLLRGWNGRARDVLARAKTLASRDPEILALSDAASRPAASPPLHAPESTAPVAEQIKAVESYLAAGAYLKARRLLDSLEATHPNHARVADLVWALQGDYELVGTTLRHLVNRFVGNIGGTELPDLSEESEPTDQTEADFALPILPAESSDGFPALFRRGRDEVAANADDETTQATRMEDIEAAISAMSDAHGDEDTQILRVVRATDTADVVEPDPIVTPAPDEIEEEDDVVVLVRHNHTQPPPTTRRPLPAPANVPEPEEIAFVDFVDVEDVEPVEPMDLEPLRTPTQQRTTLTDGNDGRIYILLAFAVLVGAACIGLLATLYVLSTS